MKRAPNPQVLFGLAAAVFFGAVGFLFLENGSLNSKRAKVAELREQDREQQQIFSKLEDSKKDLADLKAKLVHLEQGVPDPAYVPTMLKELELAGKQKGIEVTGLRPPCTAPCRRPRHEAARADPGAPCPVPGGPSGSETDWQQGRHPFRCRRRGRWLPG